MQALLLIGYLPSEVVAVTKLMIELEADMVKVRAYALLSKERTISLAISGKKSKLKRAHTLQIIKCTQEAAKNPLSVVLEGEQPEEVRMNPAGQ